MRCGIGLLTVVIRPRRLSTPPPQHSIPMSRSALLSLAAVGLALPRMASAAAAAVASSGPSSSGPDGKLFAWWEILQHGSRADMMALLSPRWWAAYVAAEFAAEPAHVIVETACILTIIYLLVLRKPAPMQQEKLSRKVAHRSTRRRQQSSSRRKKEAYRTSAVLTVCAFCVFVCACL